MVSRGLSFPTGATEPQRHIKLSHGDHSSVHLSEVGGDWDSGPKQSEGSVAHLRRG